MKNMRVILPLVLAALTAITPSGSATAGDVKPLVNGDRILIRCSNGNYLSWFQDGWVVGVKTPKMDGSETWIVETGDGEICRFKNVKSGTYMDGDNDNSIVLDDNDHILWRCTSNFRRVSTLYYKDVENGIDPGMPSVIIYNKDWRTFSISFKSLEHSGGSHSPDDAILRDLGANARKFYFLRLVD